ncbi:MAG TPA: MG2 domain-containing protein, partial [Phycisphaerae bacterium]
MLNHHQHVLEHVDDYLHDALFPEDAAALEQHCDVCRICQVALEEARQRHHAVRALPPLEASDALIRKTLERVNATVGRERRALLAVGGLATAAAIVIGAFHLYYSKLHPDPIDLQVYGQSELLADTQAALRVRLVDRARGIALRGVPVDIDMRAKTGQPAIRLASFTTDAQGTGQPIFRLPDWKDGDYELRVTARPASEPEIISRMIKLKRSWKVMLSTDKPVYQPGQTIRMRGLTLRRPDLKPVAGQDATFSITDPKGNVIFKQRDVTSRFGIVSADCPLAAEIIEGSYAVACQVGDTSSHSAVEIKSYVLPKFRVAIELDQPYYQPGQALRGSVRADYFFGRPVSQAAVEVELQTGDGPAASTCTKSIRSGTDGRASFDFMLPETLIERDQESGDAHIGLQVTVTDTAGQKQTARASRVVTVHAVHIEAIPESGTLVRGTSNTLYVLTTYADGR